MSAKLGIIGGYLGSGKTTLVNRLLAEVLPGHTAVIVNDFGSVNIDANLIASESEDTIELTNGCICCQLADDTARTMTALAERNDLHNVVCEVSGVGDPRQIVIWQDYPGFSAGPVLICADATSIRPRLRDEYVGDTVERQLATADVLLLTKTDVASSTEIDEATEVCRTTAPQARLVIQNPADPDATAAEAFTLGRSMTRTPTVSEPDAHAHIHQTCTLENLRAVDVEALTEALTEERARLTRAKGVLQGLDGRWYEVQLSGGRVDVRSGAPVPVAPNSQALVLVARGPNANTDLATAMEKLRRAAGPQ